MLKMTLHTFSFKSFTGLPNDTLGMCPNMKANMFYRFKRRLYIPTHRHDSQSQDKKVQGQDTRITN